jgi:Predicted divalent heavy-metal cations transporter
MNKTAFLLTFLAGISTIIGYFVIWIKGEHNKLISSSLGFSAGIMFFISLFDLLPNSFKYFQNSFIMGFNIIFCILFFLLGILFSVSINDYINNKVNKSSSLYKIGLLSLVAIVLHNIPEGIITYLTATIEYKTGILLAISIACHNIPEGICIAIPIYHSTNSKLKAFLAVLLAVLSEPLGAIIAYLFFQKHLSDMLIAILLALVSGFMAALVFTEILPEAQKYSAKNNIKYFGIGFILIFLIHLLF